MTSKFLVGPIKNLQSNQSSDILQHSQNRLLEKIRQIQVTGKLLGELMDMNKI